MNFVPENSYVIKTNKKAAVNYGKLVLIASRHIAKSDNNYTLRLTFRYPDSFQILCRGILSRLHRISSRLSTLYLLLLVRALR